MGTESKEIIGSAYKDLKPLVKKYAEAELPVLFTGETGSGKEVFAQLYLRSTRPEKKKITFSCATVAPGTLMSEVFGHDVGAFTDAKKRETDSLSLATTAFCSLTNWVTLPPNSRRPFYGW